MSTDAQSNPNGPTSRVYMYPSLSNLQEGVIKNIGNTPFMATQVIPIEATMGYESLTHNAPPAPSSYFGIESAYPSVVKGTCTQFVLRKCDGVVDKKYITDSLPSRR